MSTRTSLERQLRQRQNGAARRESVRPQVNGPAIPQRRKRRPDGPDERFVLRHGLHTPPAREALLQSGAGKASDRMTVAYHARAVEFVLSGRGRALFSGSLESQLAINDVPLGAGGDWQPVSWHSDGDGDYLELQLQLSAAVRIDRQFLLSRRGHFALVADAVVAPEAATIQYRLGLPAADGVAAKTHSSTRELRLHAAGRVARVFPLGLPQDRVASTSGECLIGGGRLEIAQRTAGPGLYLPVVIDWNPRRRSSPADWRSLTVTEMGRAVDSGRAAGHRLRLGKHQLLIYKGLAETDEARAVLGHHTRYETVIGTFDSAGDVAPIVMVETE